MASTTNGVSRRMGLAIATAVTGLVLAAGVSVASLVGWVRPAQAITDTQSGIAAGASATPQVVLVPIAPVAAAAQPAATGALADSRHIERTQVRHGERDDILHCPRIGRAHSHQDLVMSTFRATNTDVTVLIPGVEPAAEAKLAKAVQHVFANAERRFSRFQPDSELSRPSAGRGPAVVSAKLFEALDRAREYWEMTGGWFDPTIGLALRAAGYDRSFSPGHLDGQHGRSQSRNGLPLAISASTAKRGG